MDEAKAKRRVPRRSRRARTVAVDLLTRVEGEGRIRLRIAGDRVETSRLEIFEPPRFFEGILRGRSFAEAPDITARVCGICPVAYQMTACHAIERAVGIRVDGALRELRRLMVCGEWIESHALHVHLLHAPDFFGAASGIELAKIDRPAVERGLALKKLGNDLLAILGGRSVHPVTPRVGGFHRLPRREELAPMAERLTRGIAAAFETVRWAARLEYPDFDSDHEMVALRHPSEYPLNEGRVVSDGGLDIDAEAFASEFVEHQEPHTHALQVRRATGSAYVVGPLSRFALNRDRLGPSAADSARESGLGARCRNPFKSLLARAVETVFACEEALRIVRTWEPPERAWEPVEPRRGTGCAIIEAPRGILYHRYEIDGEGLILDARIVPPTSQNQAAIEDDLGRWAQAHLDLDDGALARGCESVVRSFDPCISCATHALHVVIDRR